MWSICKFSLPWRALYCNMSQFRIPSNMKILASSDLWKERGPVLEFVKLNRTKSRSYSLEACYANPEALKSTKRRWKLSKNGLICVARCSTRNLVFFVNMSNLFSFLQWTLLPGYARPVSHHRSFNNLEFNLWFGRSRRLLREPSLHSQVRRHCAVPVSRCKPNDR